MRRVYWGRMLSLLSNLQLASVVLANRAMFQAHVVSKNMDLAAILRCNIWREDVRFARRVALEHGEFCVILERLWIVQIDIASYVCELLQGAERSDGLLTDGRATRGLVHIHPENRERCLLNLRHGSTVLLLQLATLLSLFAVDPVTLLLGEHFLVLNT